MNLSHKNILLISPEPWSHIFVSKHHYAIHLGNRENKVFFLNPPCNSNEVTKTEYKSVRQVNYTGFPKGLRLFPSFLQKFYIKKVFQQLQELCNVEFDIVWSFDNSVFFNFSALPNKVLKICHIVDLNQDFNREIAAKSASFCLASSYVIENILRKYNQRTFFINHGVNSGGFIKQSIEKLPGNNQLKCFYAGNLDSKYIDWYTFNRIIKQNPQIDFLFAGTLESTPKFNQNSAYYVGELDIKKLGSYYQLIDISIICYKADKYHDQLSNPHKMMEYLATGKTIVTSKTLEYRKYAEEGFIAMSDKNEELPEIFNEVVSDLKNWNSQEKQIARRSFALDNTYDKQIDRIESIINSYEDTLG